MRKFLIFFLIGIGAFFGLVWYFDVEQTGGSFSDFFSDPIGGTQSLFSRFQLWASGLFERASGAVGGTVDPLVLAAGIIAQFEGFSPNAYADPSGQTSTYSIGYGHQITSGDGFTNASTISESDALSLLQSDIGSRFAPCVDSSVTISITPQQQAALYSLCYNIGCSAFQNSTLLGDLNTGDYAQAQAQFAVWNQAGGQVLSSLTSRRAQEASLFGSSGPLADASDSAITVANTNSDDSDEDDSDD